MKDWLEAFRLKTLPLSISSILMGSILANYTGFFSWNIFYLAVLTTVFLQILSNLANDYGDFKKGADNDERQGPKRGLQSGKIRIESMKKAVILFATLSLISGITLLFVAFGINNWAWISIFFGLGLFSIWAAINYTAGKSAYGYKALGDVFVFIFFGLVGVLGAYFIQTQSFSFDLILPAIASGFLATGVLNINNIRDIDSDSKVGKTTIPVLIGKQNAKLYHWFLLLSAFLVLFLWLYLHSEEIPNYFLILVILPAIIRLGYNVWVNKEPQLLNSSLRDLSLFSLFFTLAFGFLLTL